MIDVHCHILPALDDGARDLDDSVAMAAQAAADGINIICATPHIRADHGVAIEELPSRTAAVQEELERRSIPVRIALGGEVAQPVALELSDATLRAVSLDGGGWILLEPAPGPLGPDLLETVDALAARGWRTVVAHPERHASSGFERDLRALADLGALIQWTAEFVADAAGGGLVPRYALDGLVHLLGSDAHSSLAGRPVRLSDGIARLREVCSAAQIDWIVRRAPEAILSGATLERYPGSERHA